MRKHSKSASIFVTGTLKPLYIGEVTCHEKVVGFWDIGHLTEIFYFDTEFFHCSLQWPVLVLSCDS